MNRLNNVVTRRTGSKHPLDRRHLVVELRPSTLHARDGLPVGNRLKLGPSEQIALKPVRCGGDQWVTIDIHELYTMLLRWRAERRRREKIAERKARREGRVLA